jgi:hypothetical protein
MHVRHFVLGDARGTGLGDRLALLDDVTASHQQHADMRERRLVTARRDDGDRRPVRRNLPCERDLARRRCADDRGAVEGDVDTAVLSARVRVVAYGVPAQQCAVGGPRPGERVGSRDERAADCGERDDDESRCPVR